VLRFFIKSVLKLVKNKTIISVCEEFITALNYNLFSIELKFYEEFYFKSEYFALKVYKTTILNPNHF